MSPASAATSSHPRTGPVPAPAPARWARSMLVRRSVAAILVLAAVTVFFADQRAAPGTAVVAAVRDLRPGTPDRRRCHSDPGARRDGSRRCAAAVRRCTRADRHRGRPTARGPHRYAASRAAAASTADGPSGARLVPVHLAERGTADLLVPGDVVDVLTKGGPTEPPVVVASGAVVALGTTARGSATRRRRVAGAVGDGFRGGAPGGGGRFDDGADRRDPLIHGWNVSESAQMKHYGVTGPFQRPNTESLV